MESLKVKVGNEAESREVQDGLYFLFGGVDICKEYDVYDKYPRFIFGNKDFINTWTMVNFERITNKEITLPQLRDMVVLKRNSEDDAQLIDSFGDKWLVDSDGRYWMFESKVWRSALKPSFVLKPIEKQEMKEFLVNHGDKWTLQLLDSDTEENSYRVAVPKDATEARLNKSRTINFIRSDGCWMNEKTGVEWFMPRDHSDHAMVWQRSETESLNDQYAEIEKVREKHSHYKKDISHLNVLDVYRVLELFNVTNPCIQHAVKKLLCSGQRGVKDSDRDVNEAIDSLQRYNEMKIEDDNS